MNLAPAKVKYDGLTYLSVEHAFQCTKVRDAGYVELAEDIRSIRNPYEVKRLGHSIQLKKSWKKKAESILEELIQLKFDQNPKLKEKLMETPYKKYYKMTGDRLWVTGRTIYKADRQLATENLTGGRNLVSRAISKVKNGYIADVVRLGIRKPERLTNREDEEPSQSESSSDSSSPSDSAVIVTGSLQGENK